MDIFKNTATSVPVRDDPQIDRLDLTVDEIGGRKSILPAQHISHEIGLSHIPNASKTPGE